MLEKKRDFQRCPRCNSKLVPTLNLLEGPSTDWLECTECNTYVDTYIPMRHQYEVHRDAHRILGNFGAFGTGKTRTSEKELEKHILITPGATALVGANVTSQYEQTIQRDFERSFPLAFMKSKSQQKSYIDFVNGARLLFRPFDDPDKLRSYNLSFALILEASECNADAFHVLKTRLRNTAACAFEVDEHGEIVKDESKKPVILYDWRKLLCESNPDSGWIRTDLLLVADKIHKYGHVEASFEQDPLEIDPMIAAHVASTDVNVYLPPDYIAMNSKNKPDWWVRKFIYASFSFAEGLVYPKAADSFIDPIQIDPTWLRIAAHDYGLSDMATFVFGAIDPKEGLLYIYKDIRVNNRNIKELADIFKEAAKDIPIGGWYTVPIIDPKSNKRDFNKKDLITHYSEYGVQFQPGYVNLEARIFRLNTYFETGKIKIFNTCTGLCKELREYKFPEKTLGQTKNTDKPIDARNHSINPIEWMVMELPADPALIDRSVYNAMGKKISDEVKRYDTGGWQLEDTDYVSDDDYYGVDMQGIYN